MHQHAATASTDDQKQEPKTRIEGDEMFLESSDEDMDGYDGSPQLSRSQRKALVREIPWRHIPEKDVQQFVESTRKEWDEWKKLS